MGPPGEFLGTLLWGIRQGKESHSNQWDPRKEFLGTLLWGIKILRIFLSVGLPQDPKGERQLLVAKSISILP